MKRKTKQNKKPKVIDTEDRLVVARGRGEGWVKWVRGQNVHVLGHNVQHG